MEEVKKIVIINIRNDQRSYSAVDAFLRIAEKGERINDINCFDEIQIRIGTLPPKYDITEQNRKNLIQQVEVLLVDKKESCRFLRVLDSVAALDNEKTEEVTLLYYLRIHNESEDDIVSLQYLVLLLQGTEVALERILCFFVPSQDYTNKREYKNGKNEIYHKLSLYLRLIRYNCFWGAFFDQNRKGKVVYAHLSQREPKDPKAFLPLLEIDNDTYHVFSSKVPSTIKNDSRKSSYIKLADNIASSKGIANEQILSVKDKQITLLHYIIFCAIIPYYDSRKWSETLIDIYLARSEAIVDGVFQLLENVIRYSQFHKGVFSFRIHKKESSFIRLSMGWNYEEDNDQPQIESYLEVGIADYNRQETILDNFFNKEIVLQETIYNYRNLAELKDLFREDCDKEDLNRAWDEYQKKNRLRGMGLPRMKENIKENNAYLFVKSSKGHQENNKRLFFIKDYHQQSDGEKKSYDEFFVPGTQYRLVFPLIKKVYNCENYNSDVFTSAIGNMKEDEEAFAEHFYDQEKQIKIHEPLSKFIEMLSGLYNEDYLSGKDKCVEKWTEQINSAYDEMTDSPQCTIYYFDAKELSQKGLYWISETFCKGVIGSLLLSENRIKSFAIVNCSRLLMMIFYKTYLFIGTTDKHTHIYLSGLEVEDELYIAGNNREQVQKNIIQYAFPRRRVDFTNLNSLQTNSEEYFNVVPFDVILSREGQSKTLFDEYVECVAERELTSRNGAGYKLQHAHMRLGSKIHLDTFYEIAILFQKPRIAKKTAYKLLRHINDKFNYLKVANAKDNNETIWNEKILFYGYSSYTRMILESIIEMAKKVSKNNNLNWAFAIYQNDIVVEKRNNCVSPIDSIVFSNSNLKNRDDLEKYKIIQIVPVSTSLTTFKKMKGKLEEVISGDGYRSIKDKIIANYTFFWVRDEKDNSKPEYEPTKLESFYWERVNDNNSISTRLISPDPLFFTCVHSKWHDPLVCEKCYPENVLDEYVLTETDVTSTIPTVQLESDRNEKDVTIDKENDQRILKLKGSLKYGHICRDNNHFQYYFDTNECFLSQKEEIKKWLRGLKQPQAIKEELTIIVTPLHHTNAGFCLCVNNEVYNGTADIISIDAAREYKSNIKAKYADIKETLLRAHELDLKTRFVFVDDTIISGTAFRRINNLLHALIPKEKIKPVQIDEVFVLINRMSNSSQNNFVSDPKADFHAFINLNISSIRNYGTSCVMCGLRRDAESFYRRSSTKSMSEYWNSKLYEYREKSFDECDNREEDNHNGYFRMLCSHVAGDVYKYRMTSEELFSEITGFFEKLFKDKFETPIYEELKKDENIKDAIRAFLKVLVRPFFSFGKNYRQCIHDFFLFLTECFVNHEFLESVKGNRIESNIVCNTKSLLNNSHNQKRLLKIYKLINNQYKGESRGQFVVDYLIEGLTDLRSNYVIRKATMVNLCKFFDSLKIEAEGVNKLFEKIKVNIHRLINTSSDETKTLWLEYLLTKGHEYTKGEGEFYNSNRCEDFLDNLSDVKDHVKNSFRSFLDDLYIDNIRLYYDGTRHIIDRMTEVEKNKKDISRVIALLREDYYFENYIKLIKLHYNVMNNTNPTDIIKEMGDEECSNQVKILVEFLLCLNNARKEGQNERSNIETRYNELYGVLKNLVWPDKANKEDRALDIVVEGKSENNNGSEYYSLETLEKNKTIILKEEKAIIEEAIQQEHFKKTGYYISESLKYVVIAIQNNYEYLRKRFGNNNDIVIQENRVAPVYIYIKSSEQKKRILLEIVRRVLMFKHQLLHLFEQDFNNNAIDDLMEKKIRNEQLIRDKAGDHSKASDLTSIMRILQTKDDNNLKDVGYWFLLRTYVNMRISRLFRRMMDNERHGSPIYVEKNNVDKCDFWNLPLKNLGHDIMADFRSDHIILEESNGENRIPSMYNDDIISPQYYFKRIERAFVVDYRHDKGIEKDITFDKLLELLSEYDCIEGDNGYYRSEFIICILLDILFSAINNCIDWKKTIDYPTGELMMSDQFQYMGACKCKIEISVDSIEGFSDCAYLSFKNMKIKKDDENIEEIKDFMKTLKRGGRPQKGLSLWTIKQYVEGIWNRNDHPTVEYELEEKLLNENQSHEYTFITKLPILKKKGENVE